MNAKNNRGQTALDLNVNKYNASIEIFKLLYINGAEINESIITSKAYEKEELKRIIDLALELKPLMQIIKNLFVRDGVLELSQKIKEHVYVSTNLPEFISLSTEEDSNKYQEFCNYYEMPAKYFQFLLLKTIFKAEPKELQKLLNIIHNNIIFIQNIKTEQILNFIVFTDSIGNVITLKQHIYQNSLMNKMCVGTQEEKDYSVISLKYLAITKILKMLAEKKTDVQEVVTTIPQDLYSEITDFNKTIYHIGDVQTETAEMVS